MLYFPVTLPPWGMEVMFLARKNCGEIEGRSSAGYDVAGFSLSNGRLSLNFDSNNHLANWSTISSTDDKRSIPLKTHSLYQAYFRYNESVTPRKSSATYGANMYSFYPISTSKKPITMTPSVNSNHPSSYTISFLSQIYSHLCSPFIPLPISLLLSSLFRRQ